MRQLAMLPTASAARALADYLLTLKIETQLMQESDGWAVWVRDEDRVEQARQELAEYQNNPQDPRFAAAPRQAEVLRRHREQEEARVRKRMARRPDTWIARHRITATLIAACVALSFASNMGKFYSNALARDLAIAPVIVHNGELYTAALSRGLMQGQLWRLVTPAFLHMGPWHLLFNMMLLYQLGSPIEERRGSWRLLLLVLACTLPANLAQYYLGHMSMEGDKVVLRFSPLFGGMSGVIYGLFAYVWMKSVFEPELGLGIQPSTVFILLGWFFLCMSSEFQKELGVAVANMAHGAGLLTGLAIGIAPTVARLIGSLFRRDG
jgi:GlpG protein